jgi:hypothetical protein
VWYANVFRVTQRIRVSSPTIWKASCSSALHRNWTATVRDQPAIEADDIKFVVLRFKRVRHPDVVCIERIEHFLREETARG